MCQIRITGYRPGLQKIGMTKAIRQHTGLGLKAAKDCTDALLAGQVVTVEVASPGIATTLIRELDELGASAEIAGDLA
jgi:ribosomal protein L7/L12